MPRETISVSEKIEYLSIRIGQDRYFNRGYITVSRDKAQKKAFTLPGAGMANRNVDFTAAGLPIRSDKEIQPWKRLIRSTRKIDGVRRNVHWHGSIALRMKTALPFE